MHILFICLALWVIGVFINFAFSSRQGCLLTLGIIACGITAIVANILAHQGY